MERFKKRTLALVLASVITVVGASGAENYKNSLMSLELEGDSANSVNVILRTKINDNAPITTKKTDANTYIIMLPETDGKKAPTPKLTSNVESVNIRTMPYTVNGNGYTKITIKTLSPNTELNAKKALYISSEQPKNSSVPNDNTHTNDILQYDQQINPQDQIISSEEKPNKKISTNQFSEGNRSSDNKVYNSNKKEHSESNLTSEQNTNNTTPSQESDNSDTTLWILGFFVVLLVCIFIIMKSSRRMAELVGEKMDFSDSDEDNPKKTKRKQIRKTINTLDKMYEKPIKMPKASTNSEQNLSEEEHENTEEAVIVDLDELFQSGSQTSEQDSSAQNDIENIDLDDFLSSFDFEAEEEMLKEEIEKNNLFNELFEKYINNGNIIFSQNDVAKINELLKSEINDDTIKNISKYAVSNPIKQTKPSKNEILENFITSYTINQNLSFSKDDVDALNKLINVEIDNNFITDLTTNPERTSQMRKEIESRQVAHKSHEILTLNVKDMLPDLSEALKKQGGKKIEYEVKPQVVYYSDEYDVSTLNVSSELPDLTLDFDNPEYNKYRPSDEVELVAKGYEVETLSTKDNLPDLKDVLKNPEKYREEKKEVKVDENSLLESISNVKFKPFYDGEESFEISNKFEDEDNIFDNINEDSQKENEHTKTELIKENNSTMELLKLEKTVTRKNNRRQEKDEKVSELMNMIDAQKEQRIQKSKNIPEQKEKEKEIKKEQSVKHELRTCSTEGESFEILNIAEINEESGCRLCRNESGYAVIGYINNELKILKRYDKLSSQRIQVRLNEKLDNGITQYIVRIGVNKFIINVSDYMEYIMDLC